MSDFLDKLAAGPLCDPGKIFLPEGRRRARRKRTPEELEQFRAERDAKKERLARASRERMETLLTYYAASTVPIDRVAMHLGLTEEEALKRLAEHGRKL